MIKEFFVDYRLLAITSSLHSSPAHALRTVTSEMTRCQTNDEEWE